MVIDRMVFAYALLHVEDRYEQAIATHLLFQAYRAISIKPIVYKVFKGYLLKKNYRAYS